MVALVGSRQYCHCHFQHAPVVVVVVAVVVVAERVVAFEAYVVEAVSGFAASAHSVGPGDSVGSVGSVGFC